MRIESFFPGRLRISSKAFTRQENVDAVRERLASVDGVGSISSNLRTGSLTILYNPLKIGVDMVKKAGGELERMEREMEIP